MKPDRIYRRRCSGSALVLVFWCVLILGLAVFAVVEIVELSIEHAAYRQGAVEARTLAASGVAVASAPQLLRDDPILKQDISPGHGFQATIEDEDARLNLNYLLLTNHRDVLVSLFTHWGAKMDEAEHAADSLYDWVTPGDLKSLNGAKDADYEQAGLPQRPSHAAFQSWREVNQVMGVDALAKVKPDWQDSFTLWSAGPLDVNQAPAELIAALLGVDVGRVVFLIQARNGRDEIPGTLDDVPLTSGALQGSIGLTSDQMTAISNEIEFSSTARRIESVGQVGTTRARISAVVRLNSVPVQLLVWSEH